MQSIKNYDVYIFDCDGVILDSNQLKITAMEKSLSFHDFNLKEINQCINYFKNNFGKSRYHHIQIFFDTFLTISAETDKQKLSEQVLFKFSEQCKKLYLKAHISDGFIEFISSLEGNKYIASGSDQSELREVFRKRDLATYFKDIFGSPTKKTTNVSNILSYEKSTNAIMFGDSISDLESSLDNNIDFVAYRPLSNTPKDLTNKSNKNDFLVIDSWEELF